MKPHLIALLVLAAPIPEGKDLVVRVHSPGKLSCIVRDADVVPAAVRFSTGTGAADGTWRVSPREMLSCSGPGLEPVDVSSGRSALPAQVTLAALPARDIDFEAGWAGVDTVIEWLALEEKGTRLLARRHESIGQRLSLPVAAQPRVIRLRPRGASPQSVFVPPGTTPSTLRLLPPAMGGEVFGRLPRVAFPPERLDLIAEPGKTVTIRPGQGGIFQLSGLAAGAYTLVPQYRGGMHGRAVGIVIRPGETTEVIPWALPETGAVRIELPDELCRQRPASRLVLRPLSPNGHSRAASIVVPGVQGSPCRQEVQGLEEGAYEASLDRAGEGQAILASSRFAAVKGRTAVVALVPAQREDLDPGAGVIEARARREDGETLAEPVQVTVIAKSGERIAGSWQPLEQAARFPGIAHGEYAVTASTASGLTTPTVTAVDVSPQAPVAEVDLVLARHEQMLAVADASGVPIGAARVFASGSPLESEMPGVFRLTGTAPAERLKIQAAGYVPVCRILPEKDVPEVRVVLQESRDSVTVHFSSGSNWESAALVGLPGSDCPVSIDQVDMQASVAQDETTVVLRMVSGTFSLEVGPRSYPMSVPGGDLYVSPSE